MTKIRVYTVAAFVGLLGIGAMVVAPTAEAHTVSVCITLEILGQPPICIQI